MVMTNTKWSYHMLEAEISALLASKSASFMALKKGYPSRLVPKRYL